MNKDILEKMEKLVAYCYAEPEPANKVCESCDCKWDIEYIKSELKYLWERIQEHEKGHMPTGLSTGDLKKVIKSLGLEDSYEIVPQRIYASDGKRLENPEFLFRAKKKD